MIKSFRKLCSAIALLFCLIRTASGQELELKVLQLNIWQEGTQVPGGYEGIVNEIATLKPDLITFSEVRNYKNTRFNERILKDLAQKGQQYYSFFSSGSGVLSKYPITDSSLVFKEKGSIYKLITQIGGREIALYSAHLDYENYAVYLPRGYSGTTWKKLSAPVLNRDTVLADNLASKRDEAIQSFLTEARQDLKKGRLVFLGGDFNEASHLDWVASTKDSFDHNGMIIPWQNSKTLYKNGFKDSYRVIHPDPLNYPGFTFPSDNKDLEVKKMTWAPDADERERIDFIYYYPDRALKPVSSSVVGPKSSILRNQRVEEQSKDHFITPQGVWPTDHKGLLTVFKLQQK
ncbi:endonuclease/exonuclease/phosphatase family protein [Pedobacter caeni]|uniref:Exonuclease III n=1 Tax=Pedobacter caeni TaxID=288992 RepID=A0A1M5DS09_9SPHI|nr:endonuclease/exonuclease/phosphatase family protein [Pedobacter caeni]SHF69715.1 Exonuclease III [Pedobacter caeni]